MGWESSDVARFYLGPLFQGQTRTAKLISAYNSLIIGRRDLECQSNLWKSWAGNLLMWSNLALVQGQARKAKLKLAHNLLIIAVRGLECETN